MVKYWLDTEFIEDGKTIDLISIGIVCEDGRKYYAINSWCDFSKANQWVKENVIAKLPNSFVNPQTASPSEIEGMFYWKDKPTIAKEVAEFFKCIGNPEPIIDNGLYPRFMRWLGFSSVGIKLKYHWECTEKPEIWAYYADYDWVVFCQLFGTMMDLPKGFPMYCRDIKQECDRLGNPKLPEQGKGEHDALADALWNKQAYEFLQGVAVKQWL